MLGTKYLSQLVTPDMLMRDKLNIIKAPTGSGKTYFALTAIPAMLNDAVHTMVYLIDTINGKEQLLRNYNARPIYRGWAGEVSEEGIFFVGYQEGDVIPKTGSAEESILAKALSENNLDFTVKDITRQTYEMLQKKREVALAHQEEFRAENQEEWFDLLLLQTECATETYEEFARKMARYLFVARKE